MAPVVAATLALDIDSNTTYDDATERVLLDAATAAAADAMNIESARVIVRVKSYAVRATLGLPTGAAVEENVVADAVAAALGVPASRVSVVLQGVSQSLRRRLAQMSSVPTTPSGSVAPASSSAAAKLVTVTVRAASAVDAGATAVAVAAVAGNGSLSSSLRQRGVLRAGVTGAVTTSVAPRVVAELEVVVESGGGGGGGGGLLSQAVASGAFATALGARSGGVIGVGAAEVKGTAPPPPSDFGPFPSAAATAGASSTTLWTLLAVSVAAVCIL